MAENPFLPKRRRKLTEPAPDEYSPEEQNNLLRSVGSSAVSGMGYVGGMLDKFTGSRALRGVLGGKPRELLSLIPGSDTFGITDQKDIVGGKDLLKWNDPNSWADDIAGFGVEVALDPTWLISGGAVGAGGKVLKAAGLGGKAAKTAVRAARAAKVADEVAKGTRLERAIKVAREATPKSSIGELTGKLTTTARQRLELPVTTTSGKYKNLAASRIDMPGVSGLPEELEAFSRAAKAQGLDPAKILDEPVKRSLLKVGLPGMEPWLEIGKGSSPRALKVAAGIDKTAQALRYNKLSNLAAQHFHAPAGGMPEQFSQELASETHHGVPAAGNRAKFDTALSLQEMKENKLMDPQSGRMMRRMLEGEFTPTRPMTKRMDAAQRIVQRVKGFTEDQFQRGTLAGTAGDRLNDPLAIMWANRGINPKYADRSIGVLQKILGKNAPTDHSRVGFLKKILGQTDTLEHKIIRRWAGDVRPVKDLIQEIDKRAGALMPLHTDKEKKQLAVWLKRLPQSVRQEGFFEHPLESQLKYAVNLDRKTRAASNVLESLPEHLGNHPGGVPVVKLLKDLKIKRGGMNNTMLKGLATQVKNGTRNIEDFAREVERLDRGAFASISESLGITNPVSTVAKQLRAGTVNVDDAMKRIAGWQKQIGKMTVEPEIAKQYTKVQEFFSGPEASIKVVKFLDGFLNLFKASVLTWPSTKVRDLASGTVQNLLYNLFSRNNYAVSDSILKGKMVPLEKALKYQPVREMLAREGLPETVENANKMLRAFIDSWDIVGARVADMSQIGGPKALHGIEELYQKIPGVRPLTAKAAASQLADKKAWKKFGKEFRPHKPSTFGIRGVGNAEETTMPFFAAGNTVGTLTDAYNRLPAFLHQIERGVDPATAKARVMEVHVDYSNRNLTEFEKKYMTRMAPFYRFSKNMAKTTFAELLKNPHGRLAQTVRGSSRMQRNSGDDSIVPEHIGRTLSIPVPKNAVTDALGLSAPEGHTRYLTGLGLMHEDPLSLFQPGSNAYHTARSTGQSLIGRMNPLLKGPMELAFGKQAFSGRQLEDLDPNVGRIAANVMGKDEPVRTPILMEQAIANSPASRAVSSLRTLTDTRPNATNKAIVNLLSGVRLSDVDNEKTMNLARRKLLEELLRGSPGVHRYEHLFAPDDTKLTERERQLMTLYRQLSRKSAKEARERKKEEKK